MGLESLNRVANPTPVQSRENSPAASNGSADDPLAFQQQLESQMENQQPKDAPKTTENDTPVSATDGKKLPPTTDAPVPDNAASTALSSDILALLVASVPDAKPAPQALDTASSKDTDMTSASGSAESLLLTTDAPPPLPLMQAVSAPIEQPISVDQSASSSESMPSLAALTKADSNAVTTVLSGLDTPSVAANDEFANNLASASSVTTGNTNAANVAAAPLEIRNTAQPSAPPVVNTPVGQHGWDRELSERIVWMTGKSMDSAEIHLNPPHLGPIEVRLSMNHEQQANIQFVSANAGVREAIEAAVPRLREMMGEQQLTLVDVNVSNQSFQQQSAERDAQSRPAGFGKFGQEADVNELVSVEAPRVTHSSSGLLNLYA